MTDDVQPVDVNYPELLEKAVKAEIGVARVRAARAVSVELIGMYWRIGRLILDRQADQRWGTRVSDRLAVDLRTSFPSALGLGRRNLHYMPALTAAWPQTVPQAVAQLPWGHVRGLLDLLNDPGAREWWAAQSGMLTE